MSLYLLIVIVGLVVKSIAAARFYLNFPQEYNYIKVELTVFFAMFIASSVINLFIFAPQDFLSALNVPMGFVCRLYYIVDYFSTLVGAYLLLGMFQAKFHRSLPVVTLVILYFAICSFSVLFTDLHFQEIMVTKYMTLAVQVESDPFLIIPQILVLIPFTAVIYTLIRTYRNAQNNQHQIQNFYALIAFVLFDISYISSFWTGLDNPMPMAMATRGFFFFFVINLTLFNREIFDIRHITPRTAENDASIDLRRLFRYYSNEKIGHKEAIKEIEKVMVEYKITKTVGFKEEQGSALPIVANSMKISRSGLYDVLKRLGIATPSNK